MYFLPPLFPFGQVVATPGALAAVGVSRLMLCLGRHTRGDWGWAKIDVQARRMLYPRIFNSVQFARPSQV
ncbi:hypothetical protein [Nitrosospira sp. NRS527]|uniref:hypothetical protein n=1 Tax=Nitrosospira sp. NRS527 TaxID=155925 RepID=UPI001AF9944C|nr:hypothetical protein [Nitrosospira sp. NRS527]BCT69551.1 hypothetical protein NNRS527_03176 [Nitrosospira sp. NRS527]